MKFVIPYQVQVPQETEPATPLLNVQTRQAQPKETVLLGETHFKIQMYITLLNVFFIPDLGSAVTLLNQVVDQPSLKTTPTFRIRVTHLHILQPQQCPTLSINVLLGFVPSV